MNTRMTRLTAVLSFTLAVAACGGGGSASPSTPASSNGGSSDSSAGNTANPGSGNTTSTDKSWSKPYTLSSTATSYPDLGIAGDGFAVAVYVQPGASGTNALYGVVRQPGSDSWDTPVNLTPAGETPTTVTPASGNLATPAANRVVVNRSTGDATAVWLTEASNAYPQAQSVWIATYQRASNAWSSPTRLGYAASVPDIAINRAGDVALAYMAPKDADNTSAIQGYLITGGTGSTFGPIAAGYSDGTPPQVAIDGSDNVDIAWTAITLSPSTGSSTSQLMAAKRLANNTISPTQLVAGPSTTSDVRFGIAASENGSAVMGMVLNNQIYTTHLSAGAVNWDAPMYMASDTINFYPCVATNANGDAALAFSAADTINASYYERTPWIATYSAASNSWTNAAQIASVTNGVGQAKVWLGDDDSVLLSMRGIYVMSWRRAAGATAWSQTVHDASGLSAVAPVSAADPVTGAAALVWLDSDVVTGMVGLLAEVWR